MKLLSNQIGALSTYIGADEPAVRLVLGLIFCHVLALFYQYVILPRVPVAIRKYIILTVGLFIGLFVYDVSCMHHFCSALGFYLMFRFLDCEIALRLNTVYQFMYLLVGYYLNNCSTDYSINWTTSQAMITLKLIGLGFDLVDEKDKDEEHNFRLPSFTDVLGYTFFFGTYIVGPLDDFQRYEAFLNNTLFEGSPPITIALKRALSGIGYLGMSLVFKAIFTTEYLFTADFENLYFPFRLLYVTTWGHISLYKYLGVWCIAESTCMYIGYTYNGAAGDWNGLRNVATGYFHRATKLQDVIDSWNINTNKWCLKYVYKRCRFLGSKLLSQLVTLVFLAFWHGLHFGYFTCFIQEFFYMFMEKSAGKSQVLHAIGSLLPEPLKKVLCWLYAKTFLSFALVGFELYTYGNIYRIYSSLYFVCPLVAVFIILTNMSPPQTVTREVDKDK